ncbi:histamine H2 receptor-like [Branchiostoma floridae x Branchiostoma japonicum]
MFGTYLMMAVDLYYFVCDPLHYHDKVTTKRVAVGIVVVRAFSFFFGLGPVAFGGLPQNSVVCETDPANSASLSAMLRNINLIVFLLAVFSISMLYYRVYKEARKQQERDENRDLWVFQTKAFKLMAPHAIALTVSVTTTVFQVAMARAVISEEQVSQYGLTVAHHLSILLFLTVSSVANPIIYSFRLPDFRRAIQELCGLPTNTPVVVPARDMEVAAITGSGQGAPATNVTPAQNPAEAVKPTAEAPTPDQAQKQTTQADMDPGQAPSTQHRGYRTATQRPLQLTVRADVHAEPTPRSGEDITETLPGQPYLDEESPDVPTLALDTETDKATVGHTLDQFASQHPPARPKLAWQEGTNG